MSTRPSASLGRRLLPALAMTTAASGLVALLDQPSSGAAGGVGSADGVGGIGAALPTQGGVATTSQPPAVSSTLPSVTQQTAVPVTATPATTQPATTVAAGECVGKTIDGPTIDTRWGPVQVEAVISDSGQICDVGAIQYPNSHRRSQAINNRALPILHQEVMAAQSLNINGVSGATITSVGYTRSLQAILDQVG